MPSHTGKDARAAVAQAFSLADPPALASRAKSPTGDASGGTSKPRHFEGVKFEPGEGYVPDHDEEVTAPVTPRAPPTPWETVGLTEDEWKNLEIPGFLRRTSGKKPSPSSTSAAPPPTARSDALPTPGTSCPDAPASTASSPAGKTPGTPSRPEIEKPTAPPSTTKDEWQCFRVDPDEIETKIKVEADRRWREWMPTKESRKRPRLSVYIRRVRREFYK